MDSECTPAKPIDIDGSPEKATITTIEGKYRIFDNEVVGRGALSAVKKCDVIPPYVPPGSKPNMKFVVKVIEKAYLTSITKGDVNRAAAEVKREVDILRHIPSHENIATFIEYIETEEHYLLFFEEVKCGDLCEIILQTEGGKLPEEKSKLYVYQMIKAVLHCHMYDVCHRDIKPENLLVSADDQVKLTDFGLAKCEKGVCTGDAPTDPLSTAALMMPYPGCERLVGKEVKCSDIIGTPRYGAPEMFYAKFTHTHYDGFKADTWSIGVVTFIILSGRFPFCSSSNASEKEVFRSIMDKPIPHSNSFSPLATDFIEQLLNKDPAKRVSLYHSLRHPWLAEVVLPRQSIVATQIRSKARVTALLPEVQEACAMFDVEAQRYQQCLALLHLEISQLKAKLESKSLKPSTSPMSAALPARRAQTPSGATSTAAGLSGTARHRATTPGPVSSSSRLLGQSPGRGATPSTRARATSVAATPSAQRESVLSRSPGGLAVRRGTPLRTGLSPARGPTVSPSRATTPSRPTTAVAGGTSPSYMSSSRLTTTNRALTPSRHAVTPRDSAVTPRATPRRSTSVGASVSAGGSKVGVSRGTLPKDLNIDEEVIYKGHRAVVRFNGPTDFGTGTWIGLEMLEGEGVNDGSSFVDKKSYFHCPKGKGIFARAFQITKISP